jgi:hypothetical protein
MLTLIEKYLVTEINKCNSIKIESIKNYNNEKLEITLSNDKHMIY